ncbi:MAG TPA: crossover junction endodeoxyribonuclease RuvC [Planctomycetota bacterium]|nr:crossover junction endodeoxyribonuclease RuvC [Planctomycetota bacterium]
MRIFGIDPGTRVSGYGVLDMTNRGPKFVAAGALRVDPRGSPAGDGLRALHGGLARLFLEHRPDEVALETPFVGRNARAALRIGEARGVILLAASEAGLAVHEYAPAEVKRSVVGHGGASKPQVASLVGAWLGLSVAPRPADAADALGLALCHAQRCQFRQRLSGASSAPVRRRRAAGDPG